MATMFRGPMFGGPRMLLRDLELAIGKAADLLISWAVLASSELFVARPGKAATDRRARDGLDTGRDSTSADLIYVL